MQKRKKLLLIGYNYHPEPTGIGKYSGEMIDWFAMKGYDCTVITTYPYYPYWKVQEPYFKYRYWFLSESKEFESGGTIKVHRCPIYVPEKPSGVKRMLLDFSFLVSAGFKLLQLIPSKKFDYVITVVPSFMLGILGIFYKKARKSKLLYHIQDLQIEAARDLQMIKSQKVINTLFRIEKHIYNQCDLITSVGEGMIKKIKDKTSGNVSLFLNSTDLSLFYPIQDKTSLKTSFGFNPTDFIFLYSGAIGEKQGLEAILHAAKEFREEPHVKFLICGSGPYKQKLEATATELQLSNVIFFPLQPKEVFNEFLNMADVHLVIQKANAGDLVMPSKLATILAVGGLALVTANEGSNLYSLVEEHAMGLLVEAENQQALNEAIRKVTTEVDPAFSRNARSYAENNLSIESIMSSYEELMTQS
ncbi:WcaI family glycosyltransferase [Sabulibacter ruber]|uniref:WcaI family glycosyltransferase n=1 Tax=Sabulibacter ruber TaxID=2811901 RepID=UPI001A97A6D7|nr:WcaI family glycosyltransferase [Sabulibacter ruber]